MNWDALAAVGELLGAAGVIVTLAYLSVQIRQNTRAIRGSTLNVLTQHHLEEIRWASELGGPFRKALNAPEEMSEDDIWRASEYLCAHMVARQNEFVQYEHGLLSDEDWRSREGIIPHTFGFPWAKEWWQVFPKETFNRQFVKYVDRLLETESLDTASTLDALDKLGRDHS